MKIVPEREIVFARLPEISSDEILEHMSDPRVAKHMPLSTGVWNEDSVAHFIAAKESFWRRDGLGHWAMIYEGSYVGWGGFQKEGDEWDFGLVLKPGNFGLGPHIFRKAIEFALRDGRMSDVTFLLPESRRSVSAMNRLGAEFVGSVEYHGETFRKFRLRFEGLPGQRSQFA